MEYKILIEEYLSQKQILTIISGQMNEKNRDTVATETVKKMREDNISHVIWDIRETHLEYSLIGSHLVIANIANLGLKHTDRVAIVYKHDEEKHKHASTVAANRGGNIQYFKDNIENAQKWLLKFIGKD